MELIISTHWLRLCLYYRFLYSLSSKGTQPCDSIKRTTILAYKVKYISQINGSLILFFGNLRIRFFQISWLDCE